MKKLEGVPNAHKLTMSGASDKQSVTVYDGENFIILTLSADSYPAGLSVEQARHIARALRSAASRLARRQKAQPAVKP